MKISMWTDIARIRALMIINFLLLALLSISAIAEEATSARTPIEIDSQSMTVEESSNTIIFRGSVIARKDDITIFSDKMVVNLDEFKEITGIVAQGKVKMIRDAKVITSNKAVYSPDDEKVTFTGDPRFQEDNSTVTGSVITYFIATEKAIVEGSKVILR